MFVPASQFWKARQLCGHVDVMDISRWMRHGKLSLECVSARTDHKTQQASWTVQIERSKWERVRVTSDRNVGLWVLRQMRLRWLKISAKRQSLWHRSGEPQKGVVDVEIADQEKWRRKLVNKVQKICSGDVCTHRTMSRQSQEGKVS